VWLFLKNGTQLAAIGAVLGLGAAYFLVGLLHRMIPALPGKNPWMIAAMALLLVAVALVACWLPARRITKINPTIALRAE
jgi:putative ABC transport system permease protein